MVSSVSSKVSSKVSSSQGVTFFMAKRTRLSKLETKNLTSSLAKGGYKSPGILARVLFEAFLFENANISAEWLTREKVCAKGEFTNLRARLVADGWLQFREDSKRYFPGLRLKPYLESLRASRAATLEDLENLDLKKADRSEVQALEIKKVDRTELEKRLEDTNKRIHEIAIAVKELQEAMLPPDTEEKKMKRERSASKIAKLSQAH